MAEWFKAAVLKTVERKLRGFESYSLRHVYMAVEYPKSRCIAVILANVVVSWGQKLVIPDERCYASRDPESRNSDGMTYLIAG
jgi:hypothetical protein